MAKIKNKVYLVETSPGVLKRFDNWPDCQAFVHGKPYPFAGGRDRAEAEAKLRAAKAKRGRGGRAAKPARSVKAGRAADYPKSGLTSDAGTHGNPGPCEYQVTDLAGNVLDHRHLGVHTNNYAELAGIGAMIRYAIEHGGSDLWTDSKVCLLWIKSGKIGEGVREPEAIQRMVDAIRAMLADRPELHLRKWNTKAWGQIPSDFGRK